MPEVLCLPNRFRPGFGKPPHSDARRPRLPQIAVHCPVLGAASTLGFMVYSPLAEGEAFQLRYLPDNRFLFTFFQRTNSPDPVRAFSLRYTVSSLAPGQWTEELVYQDERSELDDAAIFTLRNALFSAPNLDSATPGAVGLLGATNFVTPVGWDTVYTAVLNNASPPHLGVFSVRVQTDWFSFDSEFRYMLQAGDSIGAGFGDAIGQVFFVPRELVTLRSGSDHDQAAFQEYFEKYQQEKRGDQVTSPSGFRYSNAYSKRMRGPY